MSAIDDTTSRVTVDLEAEDDRYHRQRLISWWDQDRLKAARVLVVGAGALGNELVKNLALAGVGTVVVIDLDRVENSNLSRCVFFRPEDEGRSKADVVCERAAEVNEEIRLVAIDGDVRHAIGLGDYVGFDAVLGGLDNREARLHVNRSCWKASTPWIDGAIEGLMGVMRVFVPPGSACYECTMSARDHTLLAARRACSLLTRDDMLSGKVPTTGTTGSVIAAMQVQELIKLLHADRIEHSYAGRGWAFNGLSHDSYPIDYVRREECLSHDTYDLIGAERSPADAPLGGVLARGRERLGDPDAVLEVEHDIVLTMSCLDCDCTDVVNRPATKLTHAEARCPRCGKDRQLKAVHVLEELEQLALSAADFALPANDVVTVRGARGRVHFLVGESHLDAASGASS